IRIIRSFNSPRANYYPCEYLFSRLTESLEIKNYPK
ncbi:unnamed protein product, partial [marine sediment metagenome]